MIVGKIIGVQKQSDPATKLVADDGTLAVAVGAGQDQASLAGAGWQNADPAFVPLVDIFGQLKPQDAAIEINRRVIVRDH